jgi:hypothetical protein
MKLEKIGSRLVDVFCGLVAYVFARLIWQPHEVFANLYKELLTFAAVYLLLQAIVRGRKLARAGKA